MQFLWASILWVPILFAAAATPKVRWVQSPSDATRASVEVTGVATKSAAEWPKLLSVYVDHGDPVADAALPPMLGTYSLNSSGVLRFEPAFPLEPGMTYRAVCSIDRGRQVETLTIPKRNASSARVIQIFPTSNVLPENLLKFYVQFSASMSRGHIYDYIELKGESGRVVELPFLEIDEELWDPEMKRLTLFIDPGRIKRGVLPLEEVGPALESGKSFSLVIRKEWHDATGAPLAADFTKKFLVGPPDREPPDPKKWDILTPVAGSWQPLQLRFPDPMDWALASRLIWVTSPLGERVEGRVVLENEERQWTFQPTSLEPWRADKYQICVQTTIEDLAGNNIGKPFEVDLFEGVQRKLTVNIINMPLWIRPSSPAKP